MLGGGVPDDWLKELVLLSEDSTRLVVGAPGSNVGGEGRGFVRVFEST